MNFLIYKKDRFKKEALGSTDGVDIININIPFLFRDLLI